jgi:glucose/arabinose dehydrogenase
MRHPVRNIASAALAAALAGTLLAAPPAASHLSAAGGSRLSTITLPDGSQHTLQTPADLQMTLYATGLPNARFMALGPRGDVFAGSWGAGTVSAVLNRAGAKQASQVVTLLSGLDVPHSVAYRGGYLYVTQEDRLSRWRYDAASVSLSGGQRVVSGIPAGGRHVTRTVTFGPDGSIYISVGSSCNECVDAADRAVIMRYGSDGNGGQVYARGLRNAVGLAWQPRTGRLWAVDNGEDSLGDNEPPDELDLIRQGGDYGWPYCYGNGQRDLSVSAPAGYCAHTINPVVGLQAHSAPLGLTFYTGTLLPARYRSGVFIAYHGSTYRSQPTGYKVVYIPISGTHAGAPQDVITGWLTAGGSVWGRPVGLLVAADGSLLISDDDAGVIYRLAPVGR